MKISLSSNGRLIALVCAALFPASLKAAPVAVPNFSFENPITLAVGASDPNLSGNSWTGGLGNNAAAAFIESVAGFTTSNTPGEGNNRNYLGMNLNYDVWQDGATTFAANTTYTLTVAVGNRSGQTNAANNLSVYALADASTGDPLDAGSKNAGTTVTVNTFADGTPVSFSVPPGSPLIGKQLRILLLARGGIGTTTGGNRTHFDNIRLDASPMNANLPGVNATGPTAESSTGATLNGAVSQVGSDPPTVTIYWGQQDGMSDPAKWLNNVVLGAQSAAFSTTLTGLTAGKFYYYRAKATNTTGTTWTTLGKFSTGALEVKNFSFEEPQNVTTGQNWNNNDGIDWLETGGFGNGNTFIEYSSLSSGGIFLGSPANTPGVGNNRQYLGQALNNDDWQNTPHTYQAGKVYTLRVAIGNRTGQTNAANSSQFGLADTTAAVYDVQAKNASTFAAVDRFTDATSVVHIPPGSPGIGKNIRINLQARGVGRTHWDNVRLEVAAMDPNLPGVITLPATSIASTAATINGQVTQVGSAAPTVTFYWGPVDGGADPTKWVGVGSGNFTVAGTQSGVFTTNITGLTANTPMFYRVRAVNATGTTWSSPAQTFTTLLLPPTMANLAATQVTASSAKLGGNVVSSGGATPNVKIYYGLTDGGTTVGSWSNSIDFGQQFATFGGVVTGLSDNQLYYFRAAGTSAGGGTGWAPASGTFTTAAASLATVATVAATNVDLTTATLNANVTATGNDAPIVKIYYGTTDGQDAPAPWTNNVSLGLQAGKTSVDITGLTPGTLYYFRASATNAAGTVWGASLTFTTDVITKPKVATRDATNVMSTIADLRGEVTDIGDEAPTVKFYWGTTDGGTVIANWQNVATLGIDSGDFERVLTGLTPNTTYFFRAYAQNSAGFDWAATTLSFTTLASDVATNLVINEIFFDPINNTYWTEYVEIYNPTASPISLSGWRIGGTLIYNFGSVSIAPGDYLVVVLNPAAFDAAYGTICPAAKRVGPWVRNGVVSASPPDHSLNNGAGTITLYNPGGVIVDHVDYKAGFPWPTGSKGQTFPTTAQTHLTSLSTSLQHPNLDNSLGASWRAAIVTPGAVNYGYPITTPLNATPPALATAAAAPPAIRDVQHSPNAPVANVPVLITARVTDPNGVGSVSLQYQTVDPGNFIRKTDPSYATAWTSIPMNDAATDGDAVLGDSLYSATLPPSVQTHRRLVRYRIVVTDSLTNSITVPYADDEQLNFAYFVYNGVPAWQGSLRPTAFGLSGTTTFTPPITPLQTYSPALLNTLPPWHLIAVAADVNNCQYNSGFNGVRFNGCLVYDGVVYDHILFTNRGIGSTYNTGKNKWNMFFNRARNIEMRDNWGKKFDQTWNSMSLDANACPWAGVHRGAAGVEEASSYRAFDLAGIPALRTTYVHWRVIDGATEVGTPGASVTDASFAAAGDGQYSGDFWGLYLSLEPMENNFIKERGLSSGNVYSIEGSNGDKKNQGATQSLDASDWNTFRDGAQLGTSAATGNPEAWYRTNLDLDSLYTLMAVGRLIGNIDVRPGDNFRYYHRSTDNRWVAMPYDLDMMYIPAHHWGGAMDGITVAGAPLTVRAMMRYPAIALEYRNRCREVLSLLGSDADPNGGQIGQLLDEYAQMVNPRGVALTWADADAAMWNLHPRSTGGGANTGQNNTKGIFFRSLYLDGTRGGLGGTSSTTTWVRNLNDPDNDGFSDHEGIVEYLTNYSTNTYPSTAAAWVRKATSANNGVDSDINRQKGYGYKYLEWEAIYGGYFNSVTNPTVANADLLFPNKPTITYTGSVGAPANNLTFTSGDFGPPVGGASIAAVQFRLAEISAPGIPGYDPTKPRVYEIEQVWNSGDILTASPTGIPSVRVPATYARVGSTYRVRVRHKDTTGRYSYWSEPAQFIVAPADISVLTNSVVVSEYNYKPSPATLPETTAGYTTDDFEFVEIKNITGLNVDLTDARFTKGIDFNFPAGMTIPANGFKLVVRNQAAFLSRYPTVSPSIIAGVYSPDKLSDSGEQIKLSYGAGAAVKDWTFALSDPGPAGANGNGFTVVLKAPSTNPDHAVPANWRPSYTLGGTPGADDPYTYGIWAAATGASSNAGADDDQDGIINRLEYAFGGNAGSANDSGTQLPTGAFTPLIVSGTPGTYLTATFTHPTTRDDLTYTPEFSTNLTSWTGGAVLVSKTANNDGTTTEVWRSPTTVDTVQRWFIHVTVTQL